MEIMTMREVADYLRTPIETVRYWRHADKGPESFKVGRRIMYDRAAVDAWVEALMSLPSESAEAGHRVAPRVCAECGEPWPCSGVRDETFCKATTASGKPCAHKGSPYYGGYCSTHKHLDW